MRRCTELEIHTGDCIVHVVEMVIKTLVCRMASFSFFFSHITLYTLFVFNNLKHLF